MCVQLFATLMLWAGFGPLMTLTFSQILLDETKWRDHWRDLWPDHWPDHWPDLWPGKAAKDYDALRVGRLCCYLVLLLKNVALLIVAIIRHYYCPVRQLEQHLLYKDIYYV